VIGQSLRGLDRHFRSIQDFFGPRVTQSAQKMLGTKCTRLVRELLGRSAKHRIQIDCPKELFGCGVNAWMICHEKLNRESIVYSFGLGNDITFDLALIKRFNLDVFAFDFTPSSIAWIESQDVPSQFHLHKYGIAGFDGMETFYELGGKHMQFAICKTNNSSRTTVFPVYRLKTIVKQLGHKIIDLLKIDIEGAEYDVIEDIVASDVHISQLAVEFHHRFAELNVSQTEESVRLLNKKGYKIFHISETGTEYSFLKI
jgi:FkbM family methyltransferase